MAEEKGGPVELARFLPTLSDALRVRLPLKAADLIDLQNRLPNTLSRQHRLPAMLMAMSRAFRTSVKSGLVNTYGAFRGTLSVVGMGKKGDEPYMTHRRKEIMFEGPAEVVRFRPRLSMSGDRLRSLPSDFFSSPVTSRVNTVHDMVT